MKAIVLICWLLEVTSWGENMTARVLIIDDSAIIRKSFERQLSSHPQIEVVGVAPDPYVGRDMILKLKPNVITLDLEMPRMDGLTFLGKLMKHHPMPVVVVSSLTPKGSATAMRAMDLGAVEVLCKPKSAYSAADLSQDLVRVVLGASTARVQARRAPPSAAVTRLRQTTGKLLVFGASTGGTVAMERVLHGMPPNIPGTLITQHMPPGFTGQYAARLNKLFSFEVKEAAHGDAVVDGRVLIAPGMKHMRLKRDGARYVVEVRPGPRVNHYIPSVDVTFDSVARCAGPNTVAAILTGMGDDGARGMTKLRQSGARTFAQDEASCVVYGMPKAAMAMGGVQEQIPLDTIARRMIAAAQSKKAA